MTEQQNQPVQKQQPEPMNSPIVLTDKHEAVLVKWNFTNRNHLPPGIEIRDRVSDTNVDQMTQELAAKADMEHRAQVGRLRPDRVDTGILHYGNRRMTRIGFTRRRLRDAGFYLKDLHAYIHRQEGKMDKFVVVAAFERTNDTSVALTSKQREMLELLETWTAWTLWAYDNLDLKAASGDNPRERRIVTINLVQLSWLKDQDGRPNGQRPQHMLVLRKENSHHAVVLMPFNHNDEDMKE